MALSLRESSRAHPGTDRLLPELPCGAVVHPAVGAPSASFDGCHGDVRSLPHGMTPIAPPTGQLSGLAAAPPAAR